ncbi:MAG: ABC transporter ATP-binding protein, partial [Acutalibacteraceae bacterium]
FSYKNAKEPSVENISFEIKKGQRVGIIGPTGSGKSTLINLIPRLYDCTDGSVELMGKDVKNYTRESLLKKVSVVAQNTVLFKGTLRDNLRRSREDATDEEMMKAMELAQGLDIVKAKGQGLDFEIEQGGKNLSGGQRQRISIARSLVKKSDVYIFDDSMSALDFATDARLRKAINENLDCSAVIIVSQRVTSVKNSDLIIVMDDGHAVGKGTHEQLIKECEVYKEICLSQLSEGEGNANG